MRRKAISLLLASMVSMALVAQTKLTPSAMLHMAKQKARVAAAARADNNGLAESRQVRLVVKVSQDQAAETFTLLRNAGAEIQGRVGRQVVVSVPADSVPVIEAIKGVQRIDAGHKPHYKTDVTRNITGVAKLNGTTVASPSSVYTGKGVTVCLIDAGFDFHHPAFKDSQGNTRIKAVYMMGNNGGRKFNFNDPEAGEIVFPGSVYDTPELIAKLTTDMKEEYHGTHTAGIAAGSLSPMGFGGMAPEADIVLIPMTDEVDGMQVESADEILEIALAFVEAYALQTDQPVVLSCSANDHMGPHDGTSTVAEAIAEVSKVCIPVFSAGNEGGYPIHMHRTFTQKSKQVKALLMPIEQLSKGYGYTSQCCAFIRQGNELGIQVGVTNFMTGASWTSPKIIATPSSQDTVIYIDSSEDATLAKYFDGMVAVACSSTNGQPCVAAAIDGDTKSDYALFTVTFSGTDGTEFDAWEGLAGFYNPSMDALGEPIGDSELSGGDWTSTPSVISVGAWCANTNFRSYDGSTVEVDDEEPPYVDGDYAWFSSYGTMFNGVVQPTVSAPGVNIVSSWNHYTIGAGEAVLDNMQWQGFPYGAESGTSMSCPVVSGIIALWLQAKPSLTLADVKQVLSETSLNDNYTLATPIRFGYGKINAVKGIEHLTGESGISDISNDRTDGTVIYDLQGRRVQAGQAARGVYVQGSRKVFVK